MKFERYRKHPEMRTVFKLTFDDAELQRSPRVSTLARDILSTVELLNESEGVDVDVTDHGKSELVGQSDDVCDTKSVSEYGDRQGPSPANSPR